MPARIPHVCWATTLLHSQMTSFHLSMSSHASLQPSYTLTTNAFTLLHSYGILHILPPSYTYTRPLFTSVPSYVSLQLSLSILHSFSPTVPYICILPSSYVLLLYPFTLLRHYKSNLQSPTHLSTIYNNPSLLRYPTHLYPRSYALLFHPFILLRQDICFFSVSYTFLQHSTSALYHLLHSFLPPTPSFLPSFPGSESLAWGDSIILLPSCLSCPPRPESDDSECQVGMRVYCTVYSRVGIIKQ